MLAASCGGGDDDAEGAEAVETEESSDGGAVDESEAAEAVAEAADESTDESEDTGSTATSIEELEEEWAAQLQVIVDQLTAGMDSGEYGLGDDNILRGPGGFEIDMSTCPSDWAAHSS
ncbi:MAG: hypothetical protein AAFN30_19605, partial [Actinomycetota bacterium]